MRNLEALLSKIPLFEGIKARHYPTLLRCIGAHTADFAKGSFISLAGDEIRSVGVVLSGHARVLKEDVFGNRAILNDLTGGDVFGESFICGGTFLSTVSIQAAEPSTVLFLSFDRVMHACSNACQFHNTLMRNMVIMIAQKNIRLIEKLEVTMKHSLREKVLTYLSHLAQEQGSLTVTSPLGRVDLADLLGVDRSALTRELNRMRDDGLLEYHKNTFRLLHAQL